MRTTRFGGLVVPPHHLHIYPEVVWGRRFCTENLGSAQRSAVIRSTWESRRFCSSLMKGQARKPAMQHDDGTLLPSKLGGTGKTCQTYTSSLMFSLEGGITLTFKWIHNFAAVVSGETGKADNFTHIFC